MSFSVENELKFGDDVLKYEEIAVNTVASWYISPENLKKMNINEKIKVIWEMQVE